jgi:hypothetical protein
MFPSANCLFFSKHKVQFPHLCNFTTFESKKKKLFIKFCHNVTVPRRFVSPKTVSKSTMFQVIVFGSISRWDFWPTEQLCYLVLFSKRPPLWSSGQSFWVQIQKSRVPIPGPYQIFWEVGGLERGPLNLVRTIEELLEWKELHNLYF